MKKLEECMKVFREMFQQTDGRVFFAPGRINLIGEHTDYNGGHVFPCALTFGTYAVACKREDNAIRMYSMNFPDKGMVAFSLQELEYSKEHDWGNYPKGMIAYMKEAGYPIDHGMDIAFYGEIPNGAGLSSSASIEMVTGVLLEGLFALTIDRIAMVELGKKVENQFIGVNSGIMDQFAIGMGKNGCGILLDCESLEYSYAPLELKDYHIIVMNTNKRRELTDSKYNERRTECEAGLAKLNETIPVKSWGALSEAEFEQYKHRLGNEIWIKRARHAVYENARTVHALEALKRGDIQEFGELMNQSHISLRDNYEVTGKELDTLVQTAWKLPGVIGARMTGAGFGGCAIAIVAKDRTEMFIREVGREYKTTIGYEASFYVANIGDGAREITREEQL
ncbi:Galactokinase [Propionispora sp. 2/2-37]|uniref:galactokinase n=1 Tax=Propionispora sp. 2/2-37 TaxID=1677858 RepID=UPI0006C2B8B6|nr:galactokinase [Propionispora sp. 2/2-37]CUH94978.1 Galactokinase [Propionispora sp. 2/2-37]